MTRSSLAFALVLSTACFEESSPAEDTSGGGSGSPTTSETSSAASDGADTTGGADATGGADYLEVCGACQSTECTDYAEACAAEPDCVECLSAPYSLGCLSNATFHAVASCSCEECASDCGHLCPGGQGACNSCGIDNCMPEATACIADPECAPCVMDPHAEGCADNPTAMTLSTCNCQSCGQECIWQCPEAGNTCASCMSSSCSGPFEACLQDTECADCFEAPFLEGCSENMRYGAVQTCVCGMCSTDCGVLFLCGG